MAIDHPVKLKISLLEIKSPSRIGYFKIIPLWVKITYFIALSKINFHIYVIIVDL